MTRFTRWLAVLTLWPLPLFAATHIVGHIVTTRSGGSISIFSSQDLLEIVLGGRANSTASVTSVSDSGGTVIPISQFTVRPDRVTGKLYGSGTYIVVGPHSGANTITVTGHGIAGLRLTLIERVWKVK